jgi:hypothetical protein
LAGGQHREGGLLIVYAATTALLIVAFGYLLRAPLVSWSPEGAGAGLRWCAVLFALMITGGCVAALPGVAAGFVAVGLAMPLWHGLFFLVTRSSLRRCFDARADHRHSQKQPATPTPSATLVGALLPLGGLVVPGWLRRYQHSL